MATIKKKIWPEFFSGVKKGNMKLQVRLADFDLKDGDTLVLEEFDPEKKQYTGRKIEKKVKKLIKLDLTKFYSLEDMKKFGFYLFELEDLPEQVL